MEKVPCLRIQHLNEYQKKAYILADNRLALDAGWDEELLALELGELKNEFGFDLSLTGFDDDELDYYLTLGDEEEAVGLIDDDEAPEPEEPTVTRRGDLWMLGDHRLLCGDSTSWEEVQALLNGELCDMCWTDPPYNVDYVGKTKDALKIRNDKMEQEEFCSFLVAAFGVMFSALKEGGPIYVAHADTEGLNFRRAFIDAGFKLSGCLIWVKNTMVLGRSDYQWKHEPILYGWKPGAAHAWYGGRKQTTVIEALDDLPFVQLPDGRYQIDLGSTSVIIGGTDITVEEVVPTIFRHEKPARSAEYPTMKPVGLIIDMLKNSSKRGDVVFDPFGGSGSTMIACEKTGRKARLVELDEKYCDVIVRRWQDFTGKKAVLASSGKTFDEVETERVVMA